MSGHPGWNPEYWRKMDKETQRKLRTLCPRCGSSKTYYNRRFKVWRCGACENSFVIKGVTDGIPWWRRIFRRKSE